MKPSFQSIVDNQRIAKYRLTNDKTTRSEPEIAHYRRVLQPVPLRDVGLPKLPLVRPVDSYDQYILVGEVAQMPGRVVLLALADGRIDLTYTTDQLELVPASDDPVVE
jgi:hypothetical protein